MAGEISDVTISEIEKALRKLSPYTFVNLDLSENTGLTICGNWAFNDCKSLTNVTIPDSVISIGECAFASCTSLVNIVIPDNVTFIGNSAFDSCSSLTSVIIPDSVTSIGYEVFDGCTSLTTVNYKGTEEQWEKINIGTNSNSYLTSATINYNYSGE